jgi:hypothetical protein
VAGGGVEAVACCMRGWCAAACTRGRSAADTQRGTRGRAPRLSTRAHAQQGQLQTTHGVVLCQLGPKAQNLAVVHVMDGARDREGRRARRRRPRNSCGGHWVRVRAIRCGCGCKMCCVHEHQAHVSPACASDGTRTCVHMAPNNLHACASGRTRACATLRTCCGPAPAHRAAHGRMRAWCWLLNGGPAADCGLHSPADALLCVVTCAGRNTTTFVCVSGAWDKQTCTHQPVPGAWAVGKVNSGRVILSLETRNRLNARGSRSPTGKSVALRVLMGRPLLWCSTVRSLVGAAVAQRASLARAVNWALRSAAGGCASLPARQRQQRCDDGLNQAVVQYTHTRSPPPPGAGGRRPPRRLPPPTHT